MELSAQDKFYKRIESAPAAVRGFFESVDKHFLPHNDVFIRYTYTRSADMRLWAHWVSANGAPRKNIFATMTWQPRNLAVFARAKLIPSEFFEFGFKAAKNTKKDNKETQNSEIHLFEEDWRFGALSFIRVLEAAKLKLS